MDHAILAKPLQLLNRHFLRDAWDEFFEFGESERLAFGGHHLVDDHDFPLPLRRVALIAEDHRWRCMASHIAIHFNKAG